MTAYCWASVRECHLTREASATACSLQPPLNDRCLDPYAVRGLSVRFLSPTWVGVGHTAGTGRPSRAAPTSRVRVGRGDFVLRAAGGPVDLDRYALRGRPRFHQV